MNYQEKQKGSLPDHSSIETGWNYVTGTERERAPFFYQRNT